MSTFTPSGTDTGQTVISPQALTAGNIAYGTLDLRGKFGGRIAMMVGKGSTTALTNKGVQAICRPAMNGGGIVVPKVGYSNTLTATYQMTVTNAVTANGSVQSFAVGGTGTPADNDILCFWGVTALPANGTALPTLEFARVHSYSSPTLTLDTYIRQNKLAGEIFASNADCWFLTLQGGCLYEVIFDYDATSAGAACAVVAYYQTDDSVVGS